MDLLLLSIYCLTTYVVYALECDHIYESKKTGGIKRGMFQSPRFPQKYPPNIRCRYQFVARPNEKVVVNFEHFNIEGLLPGCNKDYLDLYIEMRSISETLIDAKHLGRFCGHTLAHVPNVVLSLNSVIVMDFYSDTNTQRSYNQDDHMGLLGFNGTFKFISNAPYYPGTSIGGSRDSCNFTIDSQQKEGPITSPTYPGIYPSNLNCSYLFIGQPNERIRLLFRDLDINQQNDVCIEDYIAVYDGSTENSPLIGQRFCGERPKLKMISTDNKLLVRFVTGHFIKRSRLENFDEIKSNPRLLQKKGFQLVYKFSKEFIKVTNAMKINHIPGTECDMWIKSTDKSSGYIVSPGYPDHGMPPRKVCTYFLYGMHNRNKMETAILKFDFINIPPSSDKKCSAGSISTYSIRSPFVKLEIRPQSLALPDKPDNVICGTNYKMINEIRCRGPLVLLRLNSSNAFTGIGGFKLNYRFKRDFGIDGKMVEPETCHFIYNISIANSGVINSPFFNRLYPANTTCQYDIVGNAHHRIRLYFQEFSLSETGARRQKYHSLQNSTCSGDLVKVIQKVPKRSHGPSEILQTSMLCGSSIPGPIVNDPRSDSLSLIFKSDSTESHSGFLAHYDFISTREIADKKCGTTVTSQRKGGIITSNLYPKEYSKNLICQWSIKAYDSKNRIMVHFYDFVTEGSHQSCANSILRIYDGDSFQASSELCGTDSGIPSFISTSNTVHVRFITSPNALGQKGFKLIWSEILQRSPDGSCPGFECLKTKHCISRQLECDGSPNCGTFTETQGNIIKSALDDSDEEYTCPVSSSYNLLHVGLGIIITMLVLILLVVYVLYKEHRKQQNKTLNPFREDIPDGKLLAENNVMLMSQINPPVIPVYHQPYNAQLSDIMPYPTHYNFTSNSLRPMPNQSHAVSNHYGNNYNRYSSRESMQKCALRRAHSTKQLRQSPKENNVASVHNPYRNVSSLLTKSHNCNLNRDHKLDFANHDDANYYPDSVTVDGGTWTREKMQKISMV